MIKMTGIALIVLGTLALIYQGVTYTQTKQDAQIGSLKIQHEEKHTVPLPPIIGGVLIAVGVASLFMANRRGA